MPLELAVPVLRVTDVARSVAWYRETLGFAANVFPDAPPYDLAILVMGSVELIVRCDPNGASTPRRPYDWEVYLRLTGVSMRDLFSKLQAKGVVHRRLERMFYDMVEFEIVDPDNHTLCLGQELTDADRDLPAAVE